MTQTKPAPSETTRTDIEPGLVFEDERTSELRKVIYADDAVVLIRDESGHTTLTQVDIFRAQLGNRYRPRPDAEPHIESGQFDRLTERIAEYERRDDPKASHKAEALAEAIELLTGTGDEGTAHEEAVPFEEIDGIGPDTAAKLRSSGFETRRDILARGDDKLLEVPGVGPSTLSAIRDYVD